MTEDEAVLAVVALRALVAVEQENLRAMIDRSGVAEADLSSKKSFAGRWTR